MGPLQAVIAGPNETVLARGGYFLVSFRSLLDHLATLTRNQVRFTGARATVPMLTEPTSAQREAFSLLGTVIPLSLK